MGRKERIGFEGKGIMRRKERDSLGREERV